MNKQIMKLAGFGGHVTDVENGNCPFCKKTIRIEDFRNEISKREFEISGLCQACQDGMFGKD